MGWRTDVRCGSSSTWHQLTETAEAGFENAGLQAIEQMRADDSISSARIVATHAARRNSVVWSIGRVAMNSGEAHLRRRLARAS